MSINVGMRVSHRSYGKGTIVANNAGEGWIVKFDNNSWNGPVYEHQMWNESGEVHSSEF